MKVTIYIRILTVLDIDRPNSKGYSGLRPFHALSYRVTGNARFTYENEATNVAGGDFIYVPKNCPYYIEAGAERLFVVHFDTDAKMPETFKKLTASNPQM